jgi:hypothetical protein
LFSFIPSSPIPGVISAGLIFPFSYMNAYFHHIHSPTTFTYILPLPLIQAPQTGPVLPSWSLFFEKKTFPFVKDIYTWHSMYYNSNWFIPSVFLLSTLVPFLLWFDRSKNSVFILV